MSSSLTKRELSLYTDEEMPVLPISRRKLETPVRLLKAEELVLIPQIGGTCWFNAIFTIMLYSQMTRNVMLKEAFKWTSGYYYDELKRNKFMRFLYYMLTYNYTQPEKIAELFEKRIKSEFLILYFAEYYDFTNLKKSIVRNLSTDINLYAYNSTFFKSIIEKVFANPNNILNIYYFKEGQIFTITTQTKKQLLTEVPKIIVLMNENICNFFNKSSSISHQVFIEDVTIGIENYEDEITYNGHRYILDACIMNNYNQEGQNIVHDICAITYDNKGYVYNGWTNDKHFIDLLSHTQSSKKTNCPLIPIDWKSDIRKADNTAGFCLPSSQVADCTGLAPLDVSEKYCFDFSAKSNTKILVYILKEETAEERLLASFVSLKGIVFSSKSLSPLLKTYYNLESYSTTELYNKITTIYLNINFLIKNLALFKTFFFILTGERLSNYQITHDEENVLKKLYIALIKIFIKDDKIFKLRILTDDKIYGYLEKEQLIELAIRIGYNPDLITAIMTTSLLFDQYLILFYVVLNHFTEVEIKLDISLIPLFIFHLCQFYLIEGETLDFKYYEDQIIIDKLSFQSISALKESLKDTTNKNLGLLITKLKSMDDETAFKAFIAVPENQLLIETFLHENSIIKTLQFKLFKELSLQGLLILIKIHQYTFIGLYYSQLPITGGGSFNKNNYKKVIKQLKNY